VPGAATGDPAPVPAFNGATAAAAEARIGALVQQAVS
jgi:hypothetical protein